MGTITSRELSNGTIKYRAEINRKGLPSYKESKTFASKKIAKSWLIKREAEIEQNPEILLNKGVVIVDYTLEQAINKYLESVCCRSKIISLKRLKKFPIAKYKIHNPTSEH